MVRPYEALYIVNPDSSDEAVNANMEKYKGIVEAEGGEVENINRWEKRRLAYEIKDQTEGIYILMTFKAESAVSSELDRRFKIADDVIRHIIIRRDED